MIGAAIAILAGGAAEFRHGDDDRVFGQIAEVSPESAQRLRELAQHIRDLALRAAFVDVMVPSANVGKRHLHAEVGFDELAELLEAVAKTSLGIIRARLPACTLTGSAAFNIFTASKVSWPVPCRTESTELAYMASKVLETGAAFGLRPPTPKSLMLFTATAGSGPERILRQRWSQTDGAEGGLVGGLRQRMQRTIQPAILGGFDAGRAGLHKILRIEVGTAGVGRAGRMHDGQMPLVPERLQS